MNVQARISSRIPDENGCFYQCKDTNLKAIHNDSNDKQGFEKGCALIRSNLGIDPTIGDYEDWATNYAQALWLLEKWRLKNTAEMIAELFREKR